MKKMSLGLLGAVLLIGNASAGFEGPDAAPVKNTRRSLHKSSYKKLILFLIHPLFFII